MKSFDGQGIIQLYVKALSEQSSIKEKELWRVKGSTQITDVMYSNGEFQFRMETNVGFIVKPLLICQYVTVTCDGEMKFRDKGQWFIPGDILFDTFSEAVEFINEL